VTIHLPGDVDVNQVALSAESPLLPTADGATATLVDTGDHSVGWPYGEPKDEGATPLGAVRLIPYFRWANRGSSTMRVFIPLA